MLIRVPEAYPIIRKYDTIRPGLLLLDADGRRIDSIDLRGAVTGKLHAPTVAKRLRLALKITAMELFWIRVGAAKPKGVAAFKKDLAKIKGVTATQAKAGELTLTVERGTLHPEKILGLAKTREVSVELLEPVPIQFGGKPDSKTTEALAVLAKVPGTWYVSKGAPVRAWVTPLLLDPARLEAATPGRIPDVESRDFEFEWISRSGAGLKAIVAPLTVTGVLSVLPDIFGNRMTVVARRGTASWDDVALSFRGAGARLKKGGSEKPK